MNIVELSLISIRRFLFSLLLALSFEAYGAPDLTIVGFFEPEGGIGKVPITILETLGDEISTNFISTIPTPNLGGTLSPMASRCLESPDKEAGKVAMLTDLIWSLGGKPANKMPKASTVKLAYSMLETTKIPSMWVKILNTEFDAVVVPDPYISILYQNSGVNIPIFVLPLPMVLDPYFAKAPHGLSPKKPFVFCDASASKNPKPLIEAFTKAFKNSPDVILFMRAAGLDLQKTSRWIKKFGAKQIFIESGKLSLNDYLDRLCACDCYVNLSRGEGFSYIPRECLALNIPVIITNNTASTTICESGWVRPVPSKIKNPASQHYMNLFGEQCGEQFDCSIKDVVAALQDVYNNYSLYSEKARQGSEWVKQYNYSNLKLQALYRMLIKPKEVILGKENRITEYAIITNSEKLYHQYRKIIH